MPAPSGITLSVRYARAQRIYYSVKKRLQRKAVIGALKVLT